MFEVPGLKTIGCVKTIKLLKHRTVGNEYGETEEGPKVAPLYVPVG
jgi:hypothetical protein